jgi:hypothetical protein
VSFSGNLLLVIIALFIALGFLLRSGLILVGAYKGPVLALFEEYGEKDPIFFPFPEMMVWFSVLILATGELLRTVLDAGGSVQVIGFLLLLISGVAVYYRDRLQKSSSILPTFPAWYARLQSETSRRERRRIAYMWLRLPLRTRLLYNASDHYFFVWAELVIVSTVREV